MLVIAVVVSSLSAASSADATALTSIASLSSACDSSLDCSSGRASSSPAASPLSWFSASPLVVFSTSVDSLEEPPHHSSLSRNRLTIVGDGLRDRGHDERQYQAQHGSSAQNACQYTARRFITLLRFVRIRFHRCLLPKRPRSCSFTIKRICAICNCARLVILL